MDDWPVSLYNKDDLKFYWEYIYNKNFRKILSISNANLSICQTMSDEYLERYGVNFMPFHNPVDLQLWESVPFNTNQKCKRVIYVGKINKDTEENLITMCKVVHKLISKDITLNLKYIHQIIRKKKLKYFQIQKLLYFIILYHKMKFLNYSEVLLFCF
jgi:hypothetical protein